MTDMEKKVMVRLCAKILSETDLYDTDIEVRNLIDWICVSEQIKSNNNEIRSITGEYKRIEPDCREGVRTQLEHMKSLCKERESLYEKQNDFERAEAENRESIGTVGIWGMAAAVPLTSCGKIADNMLKSKSRDKNTT